MELTGPVSTIRRARKLRREMTVPEVILWRALRDRPGGLKFRRQHPAGRYVLDFYADPALLAVEVDGEADNRGDRPQRDQARDVWLAERGVRMSRVTAADVLSYLDAMVGHILDVAARTAPSTTAFGGGPPPPAGEDFSPKSSPIGGGGARSATEGERASLPITIES